MLAHELMGELIAGKYRVERLIGTGGMGVVYAARHVELDQLVALKFLRDVVAGDSELIERFAREARAAARIQSEHVARVLDIGRLADGSPYIVMEYLEGEDLATIVAERGPLPIDDAIGYLLEACEAVAEVHAQGMVHRDIKPANLFLARRADGTTTIKLLDFGISKAPAEWNAGGALTQTATVMGSAQYMSPEQLRSLKDVDARADLWALGITLFELIGGKSPFAVGTLPEMCASILKDEPRRLLDARPDAPAALDAVIARCLMKDPAQRWSTVGELALALRPFGTHGSLDVSLERIQGSLANAAPVAEIAPENERTARAELATLADDLARLGGAGAILAHAMTPDAVVELALDHRAGFMLASVDGACTVEELLDVAGMPHVDAARILVTLLERGAVKPRSSSGLRKS